jgi:hypothetical protein
LLSLFALRQRTRVSAPKVPRIRGLLPYDGDEPLPAREQATAELSELLSTIGFRIFSLTGLPGVGKTSLMRAGVIAVLESDGFRPVYVPHIGLDPRTAILHAFPEVPDEADSSSFVNQIAAAADQIYRASAKKAFVICDQLDPFLSDAPRGDLVGFFEDVWRALEASPTIRFLFVVSDDFLDPLSEVVRDSSPTPESLDVLADAYRLPLLVEEQAREIVSEWLRRRTLRGLRGMQSELVGPLARQGYVSPSHLQIMAHVLQKSVVRSRDQLTMIGGVEGTLVAHVSSSIANAPSEALASAILLQLLPSSQADTLPVCGDRQLSQLSRTAALGSPNVDSTRKASRQVWAETISLLRRARIISRRGPGRYSLADQLIAGAVREAIVPNVGATPSRGESLLVEYLEQFAKDSSTVICDRDLRIIGRSARLRSRVVEPARTLLLQSVEASRHRNQRLLAVRAAGLAGFALFAGLLGVSAFATDGFRRLNADFIVTDAGTGNPILGTLIAVAPKTRLVAMTHWETSDALGLYYWKLPEESAHQLPIGESPRLIAATQGIKHTALAFNPSGTSLLSGSVDGTVRIWRTDQFDAGLPRSLPRETEAMRFPNVPVSEDCMTERTISGLDFNAGSDFLLVSGLCGRLELWNLQGGMERLEAVADLGRLLPHDGSSLSPNGGFVAARVTPRLGDETSGIVVLRHDGKSLTKLGDTKFGDVFLLSAGFMDNEELVAVGVTLGAPNTTSQAGQVQRIAMDMNGSVSTSELGTARLEKPFAAVLSGGSQTMAARLADDDDDVSWGIWRGQKRGPDIVLDAEQGIGSSGALSADGNQLILAQKNGNRVYEWGTWFAGVRVPWSNWWTGGRS